MDAAGEVQRLLQLARAKLRRSSALGRSQLSYQHFIEIYDDVTATFDNMAAVKLPLCLVLDTAATLMMALCEMGLPDLAFQVLRLKASEAQQVLQDGAAGEFPLLPARTDSCQLCAQQQRNGDPASSANFPPPLVGGKDDRARGRPENLHLIQAASSYVLLHAAAALRLFQAEDSTAARVDKRQTLLDSLQALDMLLAARQIALSTSSMQHLSYELQRFAHQAVALTSRLCSCLAAASYTNAAAELLSHSLNRVEPFEPKFFSPFWQARWQLAQLRASQGDWSEAQSICCAANRVLSQAMSELPPKWRWSTEHVHLLFSALLIKCKFWTDQLQPSDAFEELQVAVRRYVTTLWPEQPPQLRQGKAANRAEPEPSTNPSSSGASRVTLLEHLRSLSTRLLNDPSASALLSFKKKSIAATSKRLLLTLSLEILQSGSTKDEPTCAGCRGQQGGTSIKGGKSPHDDEASNTQHGIESEHAAERSSMPTRREESNRSRRKRAGMSWQSVEISFSGESAPDGLLLKAIEAADPLLTEFLAAAEKLDGFLTAEIRPRAADPTLKGAATAHDSSAVGRKKSAKSSVVPAPAVAAGPPTTLHSLIEAVRAAQTASTALPIPVHAELLWRVADMKCGVPPAKLAKIWNALEYRFIYTNFFAPPLTELQTFDLVHASADGGRALQELAEMVRLGWVVASACDFEGLQNLDAVTISVTSDVNQQQKQSEEAVGPDNQKVKSREVAEALTERGCIRLLLARHWDWEAYLGSFSSSSSETSANRGSPSSPNSLELLLRPEAQRIKNSVEPTSVAGELTRNDIGADLNRRLALVCGVRVICAGSFEEAVAMYRAGSQAQAGATAEMASSTVSCSSPLTPASEQLPAKKAVRWACDLQEACNNQPSLERLVRRLHRCSRPLTSAGVIKHKRRTSARKEGDIADLGNTNRAKSQAESQENESPCFGSGSNVASPDLATIHVFRLANCKSYGDQKIDLFLVYTRLSAECPTAVGSETQTENLWWKKPPEQGYDEIQASSLLATTAADLRWRGLGGPRSFLQSCLGVHIDAACTAEDADMWPTPPLPHFNTLLQAKSSRTEEQPTLGLAVWTESEADSPLCVLALKLQIWSLVRSLDALLAPSSEAQENQHFSARRASSSQRADADSQQPAEGKKRMCPPALSPSHRLRLSILSEIAVILSQAFASDAFAELLNHFARNYISQVLLSVWSFHILPIAKILGSRLSVTTFPESQQPSSQHHESSENAQTSTEEWEDLLSFEKLLQLVAGIMVKCNFIYLQPLVAVATLLFQSTSHPLEQAKGLALLRGLIAQAEAAASNVAMPFLEARHPVITNVLLASADPVAHLENAQRQGGKTGASVTEAVHEDELVEQHLRQVKDRAAFQWSAECAEAWCLLCVLYDIEAKVMLKASLLLQHKAIDQAKPQHAPIDVKQKPEGDSSDISARNAGARDGAKLSRSINKGEASAEASATTDTTNRRHRPRQVGRNCYKKCLALCAEAEALGFPEGASLVAAGLREVSYIEKLEARRISLGKWSTFYGGLLRTHGGPGVSRLQKNVVGTGLRFKPHEVVSIRGLKESELYVVAYDEGGETKSSDLSLPTLPLSCSWPLPLTMLYSRLISAASRCSVRSTAEELLDKMWQLVVLPKEGAEGNKAQGWRLNENSLARLPPLVIRAIAEGAAFCTRGEKDCHRVLYLRQELAEIVETLLRLSTIIELAARSDSTSIVEQQLASLLNSVHGLSVSVPVLPAEALRPILRTLAATDTLPQDALSPAARALEAALLGFVCVIASQQQVPVLQVILSGCMLKCFTLPTAARAALTPLEKNVIFRSWLSYCIVAASSCLSNSEQEAQLLESLPPPPSIFDDRNVDVKVLPTILSALLLGSPADAEASVQRLFDFIRSLMRVQTDVEEESLSSLIGPLLSMALRRLIRQADWTKSIEIDELISDAHSLLEAAAPATAAALNETVSAVTRPYTLSAEPLVDWLRSRKSTVSVSVVPPTPATGDSTVKSPAHDEAAEARQIYFHIKELERRTQASMVEVLSTSRGGGAIWIAELFSLLLAAPLQVVSLHRNGATTKFSVSMDTEQLCGLFDFRGIADEAIRCTGQKYSDHETMKETLSNAPIGSVREEQQPALLKLQSRSGGSPASASSGAVAAHNATQVDKSGGLSKAGSEHQTISGPPSLCSALLVLFQRGAAAVACAVAAGAPLLAHSIIMQLGSALLIAGQKVSVLGACSEDSPRRLGDGKRLFSDAATLGIASPNKEPLSLGIREKADGSPGSRAARRSESRVNARSPSNSTWGTPNSKSLKQQQSEASPWVAAGVIAHSCVDLLLLVLGSYLKLADKRAVGGCVSASVDLADFFSGKDSGACFHSLLEATEIAPEEKSSNLQGSDPANILSILCEKAFEFNRINVQNIGAVFIFCLRVLLRRGCWHQVVALCRRFCELTKGPPCRCALTLGLVAQREIISAKEVALRMVQELKHAALAAEEAAKERLLEMKITCVKEPADLVQAGGKRRTTRAPEVKAESAATASVAAAEETERLATEAVRFWVERESSLSASVTRQKQVEKWLQAKLDRATSEAAPFENLLNNLAELRRRLWNAKRANSEKSVLDRQWQETMQQHQKAVATLRKQQQFEELCCVLLQLGNLSWIGHKPELAERSWREAVEACFSSRNILQEWPHIDDQFFVPTEAQVDMRLRSLLPLHRWASFIHQRSHHEQLHAALLAFRILWGILLTTSDLPFSNNICSCTAQSACLYAARTDGRVARHRVKQLHGRLSLLPTSVLSPSNNDSGTPTAELLEALLWFACILRCCDFTRAKAFAFLAVAEYLAADVCRNIRVAAHCRIVRSLLCIECGDLQAAHWQLRELAWGTGTAGCSLFERGEFPGTLFSGGDYAVSPLISTEGSTSTGAEKQLPPSSTHQTPLSRTFSNCHTSWAHVNVAAQEEIWQLNLYGLQNVRRFTLAKVAWTLTVCSKLSAPHLQTDEVAARLENLKRLEILLLSLLREVIQEADARSESSGLSSRFPPLQPSHDADGTLQASYIGCPVFLTYRQGAKAKTRSPVLPAQAVLDALRHRVHETEWCRLLPGEDAQLALSLLSQVEEALGHIAISCDLSEAAAMIASFGSGPEVGFDLYPLVLNGLQAWQRAARLLLRQGMLSSAEMLATHLLQLACGQNGTDLSQMEWPQSQGLLAGEDRDALIQIKETSWFPLPPAVAQIPDPTSFAGSAVRAPCKVVELLVLLSEVQISLGHPLKALCLCKWARHYARKSKVERSAAFAHASLLASKVLMECPNLLEVARISDAEIRSCYKNTKDTNITALEAESQADERWQLAAQLNKEALQQAEGHTTESADHSAAQLAEPLRFDKHFCNVPSQVANQTRDTVSNSRDGIHDGSIAEAWNFSKLPNLHHLKRCNFKETHLRGSTGDGQASRYVNLHDPSTHLKAALQLEVAEALQHVNGKAPEYSSFVLSAAEHLRMIAEPCPMLCSRVWVHQLRAFRLLLESHLADTKGENLMACTRSDKDQEFATFLDIAMTEQLMQYFRLIVDASKFVETFCGNDLHLQTTLFLEALLLSIQILAAPNRLLLLSALSTEAPTPHLQGEEPALIKKAALGGAKFCIVALRQLNRQRRQAGLRLEAAELDTMATFQRFQKPIVRLFLALRQLDMVGASSDESNGEDRLTCETALRVLEGALRRGEVSGNWISADRQLANCLHQLLYTNVQSLQQRLGVSCHLASDPFGSILKGNRAPGEKQRIDGAASDGGSLKKEAKKDNKLPSHEEPCLSSVRSHHEQLAKALAVQHSEQSVVHLLWLPPGVASLESTDLLRSSLSAPYDSSGGIQGMGKAPLRRATVTTGTGHGNFTLSLHDISHRADGSVKARATLSKDDASVLLAIFSGSEFVNNNEAGTSVSVKACSRQRMQAFVRACQSLSLALRNEARAMRHPTSHVLDATRAEDSSLGNRIVNVFARVFASLAEGRRVSEGASEEGLASEMSSGGTPPSVDGKSIETTTISGGEPGKANTDSNAPPVLMTSELEPPAGQKTAKGVRTTNASKMSRSGEDAAKHHSKKRKSIADFFAETTGIQHASLESERSESYSAASSLLAELKRESSAGAQHHQKPGKAPDRAGQSKDKVPFHDAAPVSVWMPAEPFEEEALAFSLLLCLYYRITLLLAATLHRECHDLSVFW
ncbi:hypothetical protein Efla_005640 [Eimeria flavescens]